MKQVTCLLYGLVDARLKDLGERTPLEKAKAPYLKAYLDGKQLTAAATNTLDDALAKYLGSLCSYNGALLEAAGHDRLVQGCAYLLRFVSLDDDIVTYNEDDLVLPPECRALCHELNTHFGKRAEFYPLPDSRVLLILQGATSEFVRPQPILGDSFWQQLLSYDLDTRSFFEELRFVLSEHSVNQVRKDLEEPLVSALLAYEAADVSAPLFQELGKGKILATSRTSAIGLAKLLGYETLLLSTEKEKYQRLDVFFETLDELLAEFDEVIWEFDSLLASTLKANLWEKVKGIEYLDTHLVAPLSIRAAEENFLARFESLVAVDIRTGKFTAAEALV